MNGREVFDAEAGINIGMASNSDSRLMAELFFGVLHEFQLESDPDETDSDLENIESSYLDREGVDRRRRRKIAQNLRISPD
jgi:hypothetical protein